ncbi:MAG TPA: serine/threonine-protein kinase [Symbiobacteriaceae bacterium]|jgi:serine/threonine-protein kinase
MTAFNLGDQIDHFVLQRPLGQGGMARTYVAQDTHTGQEVVLKFPDPNQIGDVATYERFRRELAIAQRLQHRAIPRLVSAREDGFRPYLALEYVEGKPLNDLIRSGRLTVAEVEGIAGQLAEVLAYCHQQGVVHRDLKPANLLLAPDGKLHVIDFGIASVVGMPRVTWRGFSGLAGSPEYMAPEKIQGERGTSRADIYAVGITLYELLVGSAPYRDEHPLSTMCLHLEGTPEPLLRRRPDTPLYLAAVIARCMRRRAAERYADGTELQGALQHPEQVNLELLDRPDPPLGGRFGAKVDHNSLSVLLLAAVSGLALALLLFVLLYRHNQG